MNKPYTNEQRTAKSQIEVVSEAFKTVSDLSQRFRAVNSPLQYECNKLWHKLDAEHQRLNIILSR